MEKWEYMIKGQTDITCEKDLEKCTREDCRDCPKTTADIRIRKVGVLGDRAKERAIEMGLKDDDLVILTTTIPKKGLPIYDLEKIEGSPIEYLQKKLVTIRDLKEAAL